MWMQIVDRRKKTLAQLMLKLFEHSNPPFKVHTDALDLAMDGALMQGGSSITNETCF